MSTTAGRPATPDRPVVTGGPAADEEATTAQPRRPGLDGLRPHADQGSARKGPAREGPPRQGGRFGSIVDAIGFTPLVEIPRMCPNPDVHLYAKLEFMNPTGSVKD